MNINLSYIAGFFDADGSVGIYPRGSFYQVNVAIANSGKQGEEICRYLQSHFKGCLTFQKAKKKTHRNCFWWRLNGAETCLGFLEAIEPFSIIKKRQVQLCIEFIKHRATLPKKMSDKDKEFLWFLAEECKKEKYIDLQDWTQ
jgi:pyruvate carboxylase